MIRNYDTAPKRKLLTTSVCLVGALSIGCSSDVESTSTPSSSKAQDECTGFISKVVDAGPGSEGNRYLVEEITRDDCAQLWDPDYLKETVGKIIVGDSIIAVCDPRTPPASTMLVRVLHETPDNYNQLGNVLVTSSPFDQFTQAGMGPCPTPSSSGA